MSLSEGISDVASTFASTGRRRVTQASQVLNARNEMYHEAAEARISDRSSVPMMASMNSF